MEKQQKIGNMSPTDLITLIRESLGPSMSAGLPPPAFPAPPPVMPSSGLDAPPTPSSGLDAPPTPPSELAAPSRPMPGSGLDAPPGGIGQGDAPGIDLSALIRLLQQSKGGAV